MVLAAGVSASAASEETPESPHRSVARRVLEIPERALDLVAWPIGRGVEWAERTNLPERVTDALYFDDAHTAGWLPNVSFGGEIDSGVGVNLFHHSLRGGGEEIELSTLFSLVDADERQIGIRYDDPSPFGAPFHFLFDVTYSDDRDQDFFLRLDPGSPVGIGRAASDDDEIELAVRTVHARFEAGISPLPGVTAGLAFSPIHGRAERGRGERRELPASLDGFGDSIVLLGGGPFLLWDARDSRVRPKSGWYARADGGAWSGTGENAANGDSFRYARYRLDLRRYQPTFRHDRSLVLRAFLDRVETLDGTAPFWELPALDEETGLRGFERNRFRDRGALLLNVEYRYPVWKTWDAFLFLDEGQVFDEYASISLNAFDWSAGGGVQFLTASSFLFQTRVARSDEDQRFKIDLTRAF